VSMEVLIQSSGFDDEAAFLEHVHETGTVLSAMIGSSS
jgi:hypothetical protein